MKSLIWFGPQFQHEFLGLSYKLVTSFCTGARSIWGHDLQGDRTSIKSLGSGCNGGCPCGSLQSLAKPTQLGVFLAFWIRELETRYLRRRGTKGNSISEQFFLETALISNQTWGYGIPTNMHVQYILQITVQTCFPWSSVPTDSNQTSTLIMFCGLRIRRQYLVRVKEPGPCYVINPNSWKRTAWETRLRLDKAHDR